MTMKDYGLLSYNLKDSVGSFTYKVRLSDHIDLDPKTGFLYCKDAILGNVGIQIYKGHELGFANKNMVVRVHRKAEHIFDGRSLESLRGKAITLEHPSVMVDSKNYKRYAKGAILDIGRQEGDNIICDLVIQDKELIDLITFINDEGEIELSKDFRDLSLGYSAKLLPLDDTNDYYQSDIEYNHVAVVKEGRASYAMIRDKQNQELKEKKSMKILDFIKGRKLKINDDDTIEIIDEKTVIEENEVVEVPKVEVKPIDEEVVKEKPKEVVKEEATIETKDGENKEKETIMKDKAYFAGKFADAMKLPDGAFKVDLIDSLNAEYVEAFPRQAKAVEVVVEDSVTKGIKVVNNIQDENIGADLTPKQMIDFDYMDKESKVYYDKLTNPESGQHKDHKEWLDNFALEQRKGKTNLNL